MARIYTKTGDEGTTGIHGGARVPKDDIRIEANGTLDELNCHIGVIRSMLQDQMPGHLIPGMTRNRHEGSEHGTTVEINSTSSGCEGAVAGGVRGSEHFSCERKRTPEHRSPAGWDFILYNIQKNLMTVMSLVATPSAGREKNPNRLPEDLVSGCEAAIDSLTEEAGPALHFLLPGGTPLAAQLQLARAVCRRAERRLWTLHRQDPVPEEILKYINRLSDLLFGMARRELALQEWPEEKWKAFSYKNQR